MIITRYARRFFNIFISQGVIINKVLFGIYSRFIDAGRNKIDKKPAEDKNRNDGEEAPLNKFTHYR